VEKLLEAALDTRSDHIEEFTGGLLLRLQGSRTLSHRPTGGVRSAASASHGASRIARATTHRFMCATYGIRYDGFTARRRRGSSVRHESFAFRRNGQGVWRRHDWHIRSWRPELVNCASHDRHRMT